MSDLQPLIIKLCALIPSLNESASYCPVFFAYLLGLGSSFPLYSSLKFCKILLYSAAYGSNEVLLWSSGFEGTLQFMKS